MGIIVAIKAKLFADRVEQAAQACVDWYMGTVESIVVPIPALAGQVAKVIVNNQDEIERSIKLAKKIKAELDPIIEQYMADVNDANPELKKLGRDMQLKVRHLMKMLRK